MQLINKRRIAIFSLIVMVITFVPFQASAIGGTIYESESNNTYMIADVSYDDYNNYGTISSATDEDWWEITMDENGIGGIWLGNIPTGCNYNIYAYDIDGQTILASSERTTGNQEYIRIRYYANIPIYVRIVSISGFSASSQYLLRFKNDSIGTTHTFGFDYTDLQNYYNTKTTYAYNFSNNFTTAGFSSYFYINKTSFDVYLAMVNAQAIIIYGHAAPGFMECNQSLFVAQSSGTGGQNYGLSEFSAGGLSEMELIVFAGCYTGQPSGEYGNLVDMARSKGARLAIGWNEKIYEEYADTYLKMFTAELSGKSVQAAFDIVDSWADTSVAKQKTLLSRYVGTSDLKAVNLS